MHYSLQYGVFSTQVLENVISFIELCCLFAISIHKSGKQNKWNWYICTILSCVGHHLMYRKEAFTACYERRLPTGIIASISMIVGALIYNTTNVIKEITWSLSVRTGDKHSLAFITSHFLLKLSEFIAIVFYGADPTDILWYYLVGVYSFGIILVIGSYVILFIRAFIRCVIQAVRAYHLSGSDKHITK